MPSERMAKKKKRNNVLKIISLKCLISLFRFEFSDEIVKQVMDELGLQMTDDMAKIPGMGTAVPTASTDGPSRVPAAAAASGGGGTSTEADDDLLKRLENLRKPT